MARAGLVFLFLILAACGPNSARLVTENNRLRREVLELGKSNEELALRQAELEEELRQAAAAPSAIPEEVLANTPRVAEIRIDRLSHARDEDRDGVPDRLILYVEPYDGRGRFVQLVGRLDVTVAAVPIEGEPARVGEAHLGPAELRDAYRFTFTSIHYTLEVPLELPTDVNPDSLTARVAYTDGYTGHRHTAERSIPLDR